MIPSLCKKYIPSCIRLHHWNLVILQNGKTALHHCANNADASNTDTLLSRGAQPNTIDKVQNLCKISDYRIQCDLKHSEDITFNMILFLFVEWSDAVTHYRQERRRGGH